MGMSPHSLNQFNIPSLFSIAISILFRDRIQRFQTSLKKQENITRHRHLFRVSECGNSGRAKLLLSRKQKNAFHGLRLGGSLALPGVFNKAKTLLDIRKIVALNSRTILRMLTIDARRDMTAICLRRFLFSLAS